MLEKLFSQDNQADANYTGLNYKTVITTAFCFQCHDLDYKLFIFTINDTKSHLGYMSCFNKIMFIKANAISNVYIYTA